MFIGIDLKKELLEAALDTCLLTTAEFAAHTAWGRARSEKFEEAQASVPDSGNEYVDEELRSVAIDRALVEVGSHPLIAEDPFSQWDMAPCEYEEEEGEGGMEMEAQAGY